MPTAITIQLITIERILVAVIWVPIVLKSLPCIWSIVTGNIAKGELGLATLGLMGMGLLIFQWRALAGYTPVIADEFVAIALGSFALSGMTVYLIRIFKAPLEAQRGLVVAHVFALLSLTIAGALAA